MKILFLICSLLAGCSSTRVNPTTPSTANIKNSINKVDQSIDLANIANDQSLNAISEAKLHTMSLKEKLLWLQSNP